MERRFHWTMLVVVGGLAAGAGLLTGGAASVRERNALKSKNAQLHSDVRQARELASEVENENQDFRAQLARISDTLRRREEEIAQLHAASAPMEFHPPMILDFDAVIEARIGELECEVAALKDQQQMQLAGVPGPVLLASAIETATPQRRAHSEASGVTKERCTAMTQKGTQCSRASRSAGKCWQHGG